MPRILLRPSSADLLNTDSNTANLQLTFSQKVVQWYHQYGRKDLPWQSAAGTDKPYHVWLSEIMLQQTQVVKVKQYFNRFITALPTLTDLAAADEQQVLALWSGLGYYNRARNLHKTAQLCVAHHASTLPCDLQQLIDLPGIGRSTAAAIMSLAYHKPEPIMDGNVKRVFARQFMVKGEPNKASTLKTLWQLAEKHREMNDPAAYTQGLMDLGATICSKSKPLCAECPVEGSCQAKANGVIAEYPEKKRKVKQTEVNLYALLIFRDNKVGLMLRDDAGIWPSLWFTPLYETEADLMKTHADAVQQFSLTHKLTHRILHIHVFLSYQTFNFAEIQWIDTGNLAQYPHPKALNHLLNQYDNHNLH